MLQAVKTQNIPFKTDKSRDIKTGEYKDPLMKMPFRAMAFTNEVGESLRPIIGNYANLTWAPVLLYIGADVYDKYKNDKTEYSPSSRRFLKQAIFQGVASMLLPIVAVKATQNVVSVLGLLGKNKITFNSEEHIQNIAQQFIKNGNLASYANDDKACVEKFMNVVRSNMAFKSERERTSSSIIKNIQRMEKSLLEKLNINKSKNIEKYSKNLINEIINLRKQILNPSNDFKLTPIYAKFEKALQVGQSNSVAVKTVLIEKIEKSSFTGKVLKSLGGFLAIALLVKPIDDFVEHILIGKVVEPKLNKLSVMK